MGYEEREETKFRLEDVSLDRKRPYESVRPECHYDLKPVKLFTPVIQHSRPRYDLENQFVEEGVTYDFREDYDSWRHIGNRPPVDPNTSSLIPPEPSILNEQFTSFGFRYTDVLEDFNCKNAIYYVNTNDGYTMIENKKVKSVGNRIVFFDNNLEHYGTNCTDEKTRIILNFNYL